jgi:phage terminase large subunit-like protein
MFNASDVDAFILSLPEDARAALMSEAVAKLAERKIDAYRPYRKQQEFHALGKTMRERLLRAGNQNGKSFCVGAEASYHLTGQYPKAGDPGFPDGWQGRVFDHPTVVWASGETAEATRDNPQRVLLGLPGETGTGSVPAAELGEYGMASGTADLYDYIKVKHYTNGVFDGWSMLRLKYYAQGRRKWQGPPVDFVWFDEEPPEDIYDEGLARTIATGGMAAMSFTPLQGMSSVVLRFLGTDCTPDRADVNMTIEDAEHISPEERAKIIASFPAHEREARAKGIPTLGSGLIFPIVEDSIIVEPFKIPDFWKHIAGIDFGWDHPTGAAKLAYDADNDVVYVTADYQASELTPVLHAAALKPWGDWFPWAWPHDGLQHDKGSGEQIAEGYRKNGLNMYHERATWDDGSNGVEAGVQDMLERMQTGRWKVFSTCQDWLAERRLYHRKNGQIVKLRDDVISASRYAYMMLRHATPKREKIPDWKRAMHARNRATSQAA